MLVLDEPDERFRAGLVAGAAATVGVLCVLVLTVVCCLSRQLRRAKPPVHRFPLNYTVLPPRYIERGPVETCDWLNTAISVVANEVLKPKFVEDLRAKLHDLTNRPDKPAAIGDVTFRELEIGSVLPTLKSVQLFKPEGECGRVLADLDVEYSGNACVDVETCFYIDWPVARAASMPVAVALRNIRFDGKVRVEWATADDGGAGCGYVCFVGEPFIDFDISTSLGCVEKLESSVAVGTFLRHKIREEVRARLVHPHYLPIGRWPKDAAPIDPKGGPVAMSSTGCQTASLPHCGNCSCHEASSPGGPWTRLSGPSALSPGPAGGGVGIAAALAQRSVHAPSSLHSLPSHAPAAPVSRPVPAAAAFASPEGYGDPPRGGWSVRDRTPKKSSGADSPRLSSAFRASYGGAPAAGLLRRNLAGDKRS